MTTGLEILIEALRENDQWKEKLRKNLLALYRHMEPDCGLIDYLLSENVLNRRSAEECQIKNTKYHRNRAVVEVLSRKPFKDFVKFCAALCETEQDHILRGLLDERGLKEYIQSQNDTEERCATAATSPVPVKKHSNFNWVRFIRRHMLTLSQMIDPDYGLMGLLFQKGVIGIDDREIYSNIEGKSLRSVEILFDLLRKSDDHFEKFCEALLASNQAHVVDCFHDADALIPTAATDARQTSTDGAENVDIRVSYNWKYILLKRQTELMNELDPNEDLVSYLEINSVMNQTVRERCMEIPSKFTRAVFILNYMKLRPDRDFLHFCDGLRKTRQEHVVDKYLQKPIENLSSPVQQCLSAPTSPIQDLEIEDDSSIDECVLKEVQPVNQIPDDRVCLKSQPVDICNHGPLGSGYDFSLNISVRPTEDVLEHTVQPVQEECGSCGPANKEQLQNAIHGQQELESGYRTDYVIKAVETSHNQFNGIGSRSHTNGRLLGNAELPEIDEVTAFLHQPFLDDLIDLKRPMPLKSVIVQCSTREFYKTKCSTSYPMSNSCRGKCLIFNNNKFKTMRERTGTSTDSALLQTLFEKLLFKVVEIKDATAEEIKSTLGALSRDQTLANDQCLVVFVLSHGGYKNGKCIIYGSDENEITLEDICDPFAQSPGGFMNGKPKLVFIQACRGEQYDRTHSDGPSETELLQPRSYPDFLIGYPTQAGYQAFRDIENGSWYINALTNVFMNKAHNTELASMMNQVAGVASKWLSQTGSPETNNKTQFAKYESSFTKDLFFFPGIVE